MEEEYMYEPEYEEGEEAPHFEDAGENEENPIENEEIADRVGRIDWCQCGNCTQMNTDVESCCCHELPRVAEKMIELKEDICITSSARFHTVALDEELLGIALLSMHDTLRKGPLPEPPPHRSLRFAGYRQFTYWIYNRLGKQNRVPVPSCVATALREAFPLEDGEDEFTGFEYAT